MRVLIMYLYKFHIKPQKHSQILYTIYLFLTLMRLTEQQQENLYYI